MGALQGAQILCVCVGFSFPSYDSNSLGRERLFISTCDVLAREFVYFHDFVIFAEEYQKSVGYVSFWLLEGSPILLVTP